MARLKNRPDGTGFTLSGSVAPVERETLHDRVYYELKGAIMAGAFPPGSELTLRAVADVLGTSLMPVRDAMRRLAAERALEALPSRKLAIPMLPVAEFQDLQRIRILLEGEAVAVAATRVTRKEIATFRSIRRKLGGLAESRRETFWTVKRQLHFAIYETAGQPLLLSIIESLWLRMGPLLPHIPEGLSVDGSDAQPDELIEALQRGDAAAARAALERELIATTEGCVENLLSKGMLRA